MLFKSLGSVHFISFFLKKLNTFIQEGCVKLIKNNMKQHNSFNTHNKSAYYYDFWRSCDTKDWSNDAEKQLRITGINYTLKYIKIGNQYITFFSVFLID